MHYIVIEKNKITQNKQITFYGEWQNIPNKGMVLLHTLDSMTEMQTFRMFCVVANQNSMWKKDLSHSKYQIFMNNY